MQFILQELGQYILNLCIGSGALIISSTRRSGICLHCMWLGTNMYTFIYTLPQIITMLSVSNNQNNEKNYIRVFYISFSCKHSHPKLTKCFPDYHRGHLKNHYWIHHYILQLSDYRTDEKLPRLDSHSCFSLFPVYDPGT